MAMTPEQGIIELERRLAQMVAVPEVVIEQAFEEHSKLTPVFTGTMKDALDIEFVEGGFMMYTSSDRLEISRAANNPDNPDYILANAHGGRGPEGPYPLRIEEHGRPSEGVTPTGKDNWANTAQTLFVRFFGRAKKIARGDLP